MNRSALLLLIGLAILAGAVLFYPSAGSLDSEFEENEAVQNLEQAIADAAPTFREETETLISVDRSAVKKPPTQEASEPETLKAKEFFAMLEVRLFGENDEVLVGAIAGILKMPEPGSGLSGLQSLFLAMQGQAPPSFLVNEQLTDKKGRALLPLPEHKHGWVVYGRMPGRLIGFQVIHGLEPGVHHDAGVLVLRRGGTLRVEVMDEKGLPISEASVVLVSNSDDDPTEMPIHFLRTDAKGVAEFRSLSFDTYKMEVAKHGYLSIHKDEVAITERGMGFENVVLLDGGTISGQVVDHLNQPIPEVRIFIQADDSSVAPEGLTRELLADQSWATTNDLGEFSGSGLSLESTYTLRATRGPGVVETSGGHQAGDKVLIRMRPSATFEGRVLQADGSPASFAKLALQPIHSKQRIQEAKVLTCDQGGVFKSLEEAGKYYLVIRHSSGELLYPKVVKLKGKTILPPIILPAGGAIELEFVQPDGTPYKRVHLTDAEPLEEMEIPGNRRQLLGHLHRLRHLETLESPRRFRLSGLTPGKFRFQFYVPEYLGVQFELTVPSDGLVEHQVLLEEGGTLHLGIRQADSKPVSDPGHGAVFILSYVDPVADHYKHLNLRRRILLSYQKTTKIERMLPGTWSLATDSKSAKDDALSTEVVRFIVHPGEQTRIVDVP